MSQKTSDSFFDRMSRSDTYASRKLKERRFKVKEDGRPLFNLEVEAEPSPTDSTYTHSLPLSSDASVKSNYSRSSTRGDGKVRGPLSSDAPVKSNYSTRPSTSRGGTVRDPLSSHASVKSNYSSRSSANRGGNVFERLASTNTKSSYRKSKTSKDYDSINEGTRKNTLIRNFKGSTLLFG